MPDLLLYYNYFFLLFLFLLLFHICSSSLTSTSLRRRRITMPTVAEEDQRYRACSCCSRKDESCRLLGTGVIRPERKRRREGMGPCYLFVSWILSSLLVNHIHAHTYIPYWRESILTKEFRPLANVFFPLPTSFFRIILRCNLPTMRQRHRRRLTAMIIYFRLCYLVLPTSNR